MYIYLENEIVSESSAYIVLCDSSQVDSAAKSLKVTKRTW